jgi:hypothetical protein
LDDYAKAFVAEQVALQSDDQGNPMELYHNTYLAADSTDTLHYGNMLHDPDRATFEVAMQDEIDRLFRHDTIAVIPADTMPAGSKPLSAIWSFCRKRLPCWTIVKWKSRLCPHGGQQVEGVNFWHTYAPVVKWSTVRLTLILNTLLGYQSRQVDFVQAFSQADIDCDVYMRIPKGFIVDGTTLKFDPNHSTTPSSREYVLKLKKIFTGFVKQAIIGMRS